MVFRSGEASLNCYRAGRAPCGRWRCLRVGTAISAPPQTHLKRQRTNRDGATIERPPRRYRIPRHPPDPRFRTHSWSENSGRSEGALRGAELASGIFSELFRGRLWNGSKTTMTYLPFSARRLFENGDLTFVMPFLCVTSNGSVTVSGRTAESCEQEREHGSWCQWR